jgi:branched-chain amino acid transport system permease protein
MVAAPEPAAASASAPAAARAGVASPRVRAVEVAFWIAPFVAFFVLADRRVLLSQVFIYGLLAMSLDLILGYAGIMSLGHAAFFGAGAYTAGLLARHGWTEPLSGLLAAGATAAIAGFAVSTLVVRGADLSRLMVTMGVGLLLFEAANHASSITGGVEGLADMQPARLLGRFGFGIDGTTACVYTFAVLALLFWLARRLVGSPFGLGLRAIRENPRRVPALGIDVARRLRAIFTLAAAIAGVAGALLAQTTQFVGIETLGFQRSAEVLIMLVLGGSGRLYGGLLGAAVFMVAQDYLSGVSPEYWQFWLGAALAALVLVARGGILGALVRARRLFARGSGA